MVRGSNPSVDKILHTCPDWPGDPSRLLYNWYWVFPGGKERTGHDADPSPPSSAPYEPYNLYRASVRVQGYTLPYLFTLNYTVRFTYEKKKKLHKKLNWMFSGTAQVSQQVYQFFFCQFCVPSNACDCGGEKQGCGIPWVNCAVVCVKDDRKGHFWGLRHLPVKTAQFTQFFRHTVKSLSFTESV